MQRLRETTPPPLAGLDYRIHAFEYTNAGKIKVNTDMIVPQFRGTFLLESEITDPRRQSNRQLPFRKAECCYFERFTLISATFSYVKLELQA